MGSYCLVVTQVSHCIVPYAQMLNVQFSQWTVTKATFFDLAGKYVEGLSSIVTAIQTGWLIRAKLSYASHFPLG